VIDEIVVYNSKFEIGLADWYSAKFKPANSKSLKFFIDIAD